jgi:hypothetical protein
MRQQSAGAQPSRAFHVKPVRFLTFIAFILLTTALTAWLAVKSLEPDFWNGLNSTRHAWVSTAVNSMPVGLRVAAMGLAALFFARFAFGMLRRWESGLPELVLSSNGIEGYSKGFGLGRKAFAWNNVHKIQFALGNMNVFAKKTAVFAPRECIIVPIAMIGIHKNEILREIGKFRLP